MTLIDDLIPVLAAAALLVRSLAHRSLMKAAQPLRLELARKGELFLANPNVGTRNRASVEMMLNSAFGRFWMMLAAVVLMPIAMIFIMAPNGSYWKEEDARRKLAPELRAAYADIQSLHIRILFAHHPICMLLVELEVLLIAPAIIIASALLRGSLLPRFNSATLFSALEVQPASLLRRQHASLQT